MIFLHKCCLVFFTMVFSGCTYTVKTNDRGEQARSISFSSIFREEEKLSSENSPSKNIFYVPAMFGSKPQVFTKNNIIKGVLNNRDEVKFELVLLANFNKENEERYALDLMVEKEGFPYEFSRSDELTLSPGKGSFNLKPNDLGDVEKTTTSSIVINNEKIEEKSSRYFQSITFIVTKEEMDAITTAEKLHLSLNFLNATSIMNADLEQVNLDIIREFAQVVARNL